MGSEDVLVDVAEIGEWVVAMARNSGWDLEDRQGGCPPVPGLRRDGKK
jgi:hypothetical protein